MQGDTSQGAESRPTLRGIPDLVATGVAIPAGIYLSAHAASGLAAFGAAVFSLGLVAMLLTSGLYHAVTWSPRRLALMSRLDHAAIFVLIAASYTPFCLCADVPIGPYVLGVAWACGVFGVVHSLFAAAPDRAIRAAFYVLLGVGLSPCVPSLYWVLPGEAFARALGGGAAYILGAGVYVKRWPDPSPRHFGYHEVFHLFVFAGAASHYGAIWRIVT